MNVTLYSLYHGYPHHYFNASEQGLEQVFAPFIKLRSGVAPYQMPSFAIRMLLLSYLRDMGTSDDSDIPFFRALLQNVLDQPLGTYDDLFSEGAALNTAAGVFYFGMKDSQEVSSVIPAVVQEAWRTLSELQRKFPNMFNLGTADNIMIWAKQEGVRQFEAISSYFEKTVPFKKDQLNHDVEQREFVDLDIVEPKFGNIDDVKRAESATKMISPLQQRVDLLEKIVNEKDRHIIYLEELLKKIESGRIMKLLRMINR